MNEGKSDLEKLILRRTSEVPADLEQKIALK